MLTLPLVGFTSRAHTGPDKIKVMAKWARFFKKCFRHRIEAVLKEKCQGLKKNETPLQCMWCEADTLEARTNTAPT